MGGGRGVWFADYEELHCLLLCSQLYLWRSPLFSEICLYVRVVFFHPTIELVTFHLHRWCMLGVFFVAGTLASRT